MDAKKEAEQARDVISGYTVVVRHGTRRYRRGMSKPGEEKLRRMKRLVLNLDGAKAATVVGSSNQKPSERWSFTLTAIGPDA